MRTSLKVVTIAVVVLLAASTAYLFTLNARSQATAERARLAEQETMDQYAQAIGEIAEIQDSLSTIVPDAGDLPGAGSGFTSERALGGPSSGEILERIASLRAGLQRGRDRIARLEDDLRTSGLRVVSLQKLLNGLRRDVKEKENQLAAISDQLAMVRDTVRLQDEAIAERETELATVYFVTGTKRALLESGVIEARGGVLGLGKTLKPSARAPEELFTALNTDEANVLPLGTAKAQVVSAQPLSSYELREVDGRMELHILDPGQFRKVRQLVIVTA